MGERQQRTYPEGVTCWVDTDQPDVGAARQFYGDLFGLTFTDAMPPQAPSSYVIAQRDGRDAAAIAGPAQGPARWNTYIAVDDVHSATARLTGVGAQVLNPPADAGPGGRTATLIDPGGAELRLWQARKRLGAQIVNETGAWNFSDLHTADPAGAADFYATGFGRQVADQGWSTSLRVPGYGENDGVRAATIQDPQGAALTLSQFAPANG